MAPAAASDAGPSKARLLVLDFAMAFMWVSSGPLVKMFVYEVLGMGSGDPVSEFVKCACSITNMFFFALLGKLSQGGSYNPLNVLSDGVSGDFSRFLYVFGARIPAQVFGSVSGVRFMIKTFPEIGLGPRLQVEIHHGALTEGLLTFAIVMISLVLARNIPGNFFMKTWISSVMKVTLHILGSDLTGGCMNPASVMGWAYARGDHLTREHIFVYWLAPVGATLLAAWMFKLLVPPLNEIAEKEKLKKSE
ncbi:Probable aquaporin SIP2-1 [Linum perenne]